MAKLLIQESAGVREFELVDDEIQIGRELDNALRISDPSISRHHAVLRRTTAGYEIQDLGSSNGVLVNGARVQSSPLVNSDRVTLGQLHMTFVDPRPVEEVASPLGTVRINPTDMAKMHIGSPDPLPTEPVASLQSKAPVPARPLPPPSAYSTAKTPAEDPELTPEITITKVTLPGTYPSADNPAPGFLQPWLPTIPDEAEPVLKDGAPERGDFVTRLIAYLLDLVPLIVIFVFFYVLTFMLPSNSCLLALLVGIPGLVLSTAYGVVFLPWCWSRFGASPGKKIMKLRIVPEDDPSGHIEFGAAFVRLIGHIVSGALLYLPYLLIFGSERKGLQDLFSKSVCIKVDK